MNRKTAIKLSPLAAAVALALAAPLAQAAAPAAGTLPGAFYTNSTSTSTPAGTATGVGATGYTIAGNVGTIQVASGASVLQWGGTSSNVQALITPSTSGTITTAAGFNIGPNATLSVQNTAAGVSAVLISDITTQGSQIFGTLNAQSALATPVSADAPVLFIANGNGVIVGSSAVINAANGVAVLGYQPNQTDFVDDTKTDYGTVVIGKSTQTNNGAVSVQTGAGINAGYMLVAGNGAVSVGATPAVAGAASGTYIAAGSNVTAAGLTGGGTTPAIAAGTAPVLFTGTPLSATPFNTAATVEFLATPTTLGINQLAAAGNVTVDGNSHLLLQTPAALPAYIGGSLANNGDLILVDAVSDANNVAAAAVTLQAGGSINSNGGIYFNGGATPQNLNVYAGSAGNILLGGVVRGTQNSAPVTAGTLTMTAGNTILVDAAIAMNAATTGVGANVAVDLTAGNQIGIGIMSSSLLTAANVTPNSGSITTPTTATVALSTTNTVAPVNAALTSGLGVVVGNSGSVSTGTLNVSNATSNSYAGSSLFNGNVAAATAFNYTGNSFYQGAGATITSPIALFTYSGDLTGGVSGWTQSTDLYKNGVVFSGNTALYLNPIKIGTDRQNTNVLVNGNATVNDVLPSVITEVTKGTSITNNSAFKPSNLFVRAAGGNLTLDPTNIGGSVGSFTYYTTATGTAPQTGWGTLGGTYSNPSLFYWPGAMYLSNVATGKLAELAPIVGGGAIQGGSVTLYSTTGTTTTTTTSGPVTTISNGMPMVSPAGYGVFLMTNSAPGITTVVTNTGSNVNTSTTGLPSFATGGTASAYVATVTGNVSVYSAPGTVVDYTSHLPNE